MKHIFLRGQAWRVRNQAQLGARTRFSLEDPESGETIEALCPPDEFDPLVEPGPTLDQRSLIPYRIWRSHHEALRLQTPPEGRYAAFVAGRISPEPYQFAPLARLLNGPRRSLLIADDVGLGKTIEAGICLLELMARGVAKRILLVIPPGLIPQWLDEMWQKFGLEFQPIENSAGLDRAQTMLSEGLQPWALFDRVITSVEYLKRRDVHAAALARPWDVIVVDEAHYLAESGTPANPYSTARTRLGPKLREASRALILLTATPHNGYRHSFRSLLELVEPVQAALHGEKENVRRRVARSMIRRLKPQIVKSAPDGSTQPAFPIRVPVQRIEVTDLSDEEREIFALVTEYCAKTVKAAAGSEEADLVSFAMQIVKKRMLSSRAALRQTVKNRLEALSSRRPEEPPTRAEVRELQGDLPLTEAAMERTAARVVRAAIARDARRREAEKRQLKTIEKLLDRVAKGVKRGAALKLLGRLEPGAFFFKPGAARKSSGSFYTRTEIVDYEVREALAPLVAGKSAGQIEALRVIDLACGSGHYLVGAARYLGARLFEAYKRECAGDPPPAFQPDRAPSTEVRKGWDEEGAAWCKRRIVEKCLFGVDLNPAAVQLAQVALWIESLAGDRPLSFFAHHIRCGNSLLGSWLARYDAPPHPKLGKPRDKQTRGIFEAQLKKRLEEALAERRLIDAPLPPEVRGDTPDEYAYKEDRLRRAETATAQARLLLDLRSAERTLQQRRLRGPAASPPRRDENRALLRVREPAEDFQHPLELQVRLSGGGEVCRDIGGKRIPRRLHAP